MEYRVKAETVGVLAERLLRRKKTGRVRLLLSNTAYIDVNGRPVILTRSRERSPLTINLEPLQTEPLHGLIKYDTPAILEGETLQVGELSVSLTAAESYYTRLPGNCRISVMSKDLVKSAFLLSCFYQVEAGRRLVLAEAPQLAEFIKGVVIPYVDSRCSAIVDFRCYFSLLGLGEGFTPSGDDFLSGFLATLNTYSRFSVTLPVEEILGRTSWASGMLLYYFHRGFYGEGLSRLLRSLAGEGSLFDALLYMVRLGHTSGIDTSLGVVIAAAMLVEERERDHTLVEVISRINPSLVESG